MRSAPTLKIWITPFASVAMLEKLALLKIARCRAPAFSSTSSACLREVTSPALPEAPTVDASFPLAMVLPPLTADFRFQGLGDDATWRLARRSYGQPSLRSV